MSNHTLEDFENSRSTLLESATSSLTQARADFASALTDHGEKNHKFTAKIDQVNDLIFAPLADEKVQTTFTRADGKSVSEIIVIGPRVASFKQMLQKRQPELKKYWAQWSDVQQEIFNLGVEVLGPGSLEGNVKFGGKGRRSKRNTEPMELEHSRAVRELEEEIKSTGVKVLKKMTAMEKVCFCVVSVGSRYLLHFQVIISNIARILIFLF